jgi:hypothetical protein
MSTAINYKQSILEIYFTMNRNEHWNEYIPYMKLYSSVLFSLKKDISTAASVELLQEYIQYLILLFKFIGYTRDIYHGKGEQDLTYLMIFVFYQYFPIPALYILNLLPQLFEADAEADSGSGPDSICSLPYGSWKDIPRFCKFVRYFSKLGEKDPLIDTVIGFMNHQIDIDFSTWKKLIDQFDHDSSNPMKLVEPIRPNPKDHISLACKWSPRENSAMHWLFERCVIQWVRSVKPHYFKSVTCESQFHSAFKKAKSEYRKMISRMSKDWQIPQIHQCSRSWNNIQPSQVSSYTLHNNRRAFLNIDSQGNVRHKTMKEDDRIVCAAKFEKFFLDGFPVYAGGSASSGSSSSTTYHNMDLSKLFKSIVYKSPHLTEQYFLQKTWVNTVLSIQSISSKHYILPILDLSLFSTPSYYSALGIASILSHLSPIGKRILAFDSSPSWIDLDGFQFNIIDIVEHIHLLASQKHIGSSVLASMELIIQCLFSSHTDLQDISNMVLVIISDFHNIYEFQQVHESVVSLFEKHSILAIPKIVYWNVAGVCSSTCIDSISVYNAYVVSGCSLAVLRYLCSRSDWTSISSWSFFQHLLSNPRYHVLENYMHTLLSSSSSH